LFKGSMSPFNWVVFAVVRRIVGKPNAHPMLVCEVYSSFHELCTPAAIFGTIVLIDHQRRRPVLRFPFGPERLYAIPYIVTCYFRLCKGDK